MCGMHTLQFIAFTFAHGSAFMAFAFTLAVLALGHELRASRRSRRNR